MAQSWEDYFQHEEDINMGKCYDAAAQNGIPPIQADLCDNGNEHCPLCPFKAKEPNSKGTIRSRKDANR